MRHEFERWSVGAPRNGAPATAADVAADAASADTVSVPAGEDTSAPLQALIELGLARGFLTRGDIVDALAQHADDDAQIAATTMTLRELGIVVREAAATQPAWPPERDFVNADAVPGAPLALLVGHTSDPVKLYLREMGATPLLERNEEIALALRLERARIACIEAKRHAERGMPLLDLIQEGNIGLMKAVDPYDVRRGFRFSTYPTWWVRQAITHALADQGRMIRLPTHIADALGKLSRLAREHAQRHGGAAAPAALAARMGVSIGKVRELMSIVKQPLSADLPITRESDQTLTETFADLRSPSPEDHASAAQLRAAVACVIGSLPRREAWILRLRYGIDVACEHSLREIGEQLHLSAERVRQIEATALERLRSNEQLPTLRSLIRCDS